jgi:hypothetical protein
MTSPKRTKKRQRKTAIVPRIVFQTVVAMSVVPAAGALASGCGGGQGPAADAGHDVGFGVADAGPPNDAAFSVAVPVDSGVDSAMFGVADTGPPPHDSGFFSVAAPLDSGIFGVAAKPPDAAT